MPPNSGPHVCPDLGAPRAKSALSWIFACLMSNGCLQPLACYTISVYSDDLLSLVRKAHAHGVRAEFVRTALGALDFSDAEIDIVFEEAIEDNEPQST